jgi:hypothetical protein
MPEPVTPVRRIERIQRQELEALSLATDNQRERYAAGLLPEDELLAIARAELFKPFDGFKRWRTGSGVKSEDVRHDRDCQDRTVIFETTQAGELSHDEWSMYRTIGEARNKSALHSWFTESAAVTIEPLTHWATCTSCKGEAARSSVKVSVQWAGRVLVREYSLQ